MPSRRDTIAARAGRLGSGDHNPGLFLREFRTEKGLTLAEVSERTGIPVSTLSKVETGKMSLSYEKLVRLSHGLDIDIARLFAAPVSPSVAAQRPATCRPSSPPASPSASSTSIRSKTAMVASAGLSAKNSSPRA